MAFARRSSDRAPPAHPADLDGFAFLDDDGYCAVAVREFEHTFAGFVVSFDVVLDEIHAVPLQVFAGGFAVGTPYRSVEFYVHALILASVG